MSSVEAIECNQRSSRRQNYGNVIINGNDSGDGNGTIGGSFRSDVVSGNDMSRRGDERRRGDSHNRTSHGRRRGDSHDHVGHGRRRRRRRIRRLNKPYAGLVFLLPGLAGFGIFYIWPFCVSLYYSFLSRPINGAFVGINNYVDMFHNNAYLIGLSNTARFIGISVPLSMALSLLIALMIRGLLRNKEFYTLLFLIPLVIPSGSMVMFWKTLLSRDGALNGILHSYGIDRLNWLDSGLTFWVIVAIFTWKNLGFNMVLFISGLGSIPADYYEAARVDGARPSQAFFRITLPHLAATSVLVLILSIVNSFKVFKEIYLITGSYPHESIYTLQHFMNNMFASLNYPKLTTATTILVVIIAVLTQGLLKIERRASA